MDPQRLLDTFLALVQIDSPSQSESQVAAYCRKALEESGFSVAFDDSQKATGSDTGNLIASLPGTVDAHIVLSAHMDCVDPCIGVRPVVEGGYISSSGDTVLGADDKAGIAAILEAVRAFIEDERDRPRITVLLTTCEELSLLGASSLPNDVFAGDIPCFVFDADGPPGTIIVGAPFHYTFQAEFRGRAAHAGVEPEAGASAVQMAAHAMAAMRLGRLDEDTTANIGLVEGGHQVNIVPDRCMISGECRSLHEAKVDDCRDQMTQACEQAARRFGGTVETSWRLDYPGVLYDEGDPLVATLCYAAHAAGLDPQFAVSGGGSDANLLKAKGARAITLGIGMEGFHSLDERISIEDLGKSARYCEAIIGQYAG